MSETKELIDRIKGELKAHYDEQILRSTAMCEQQLAHAREESERNFRRARLWEEACRALMKALSA